MTTTIQVSRGLCAPMRDDVLTALKPFGVKILAFDCWGEGHYHLPVPPSMRMPDSDKWARRHVAHVTVSDAQAAWAERLLWKSGKVWLDSPPLNPRLNWNMPAECKAGTGDKRSRGERYRPWSERKAQRRRRDGGLLGAIGKLFK